MKQIGAGSSSRVFLVKSSRNELLVMKEREASYWAKDEARLLYSLRAHPCIVLFKDAFFIEDIQKICIVMEQGKTDLKLALKEFVNKRENVPLVTVCSWLAQIALGLAFLHELDIAHRDVKPANLFILNDGRLVLGDFGISRQRVHKTNLAKTFLGTPYYLSPEILLRAFYGTNSDIWSFGCVAFEIITSGRSRAFKAQNLALLSEQILSAKIRWNEFPENSASFLPLIRNTIVVNPQHRWKIADLIKNSVIIRGVGSFVADLAEGRFYISEKRAVTLIEQLTFIGLKDTIVAGLKVGLARKQVKAHNENIPMNSQDLFLS